MHIVEENAEGFLRAFHGQQTEMIVAMLILTVRRKDLSLFTSLLEGVAEVDQALGKEIGLFLFYPGQSPGLAEKVGREARVLAGERLDPASQIGPGTRANTVYYSVDATWPDPYLVEHVAKLVAQSSANIVQDFCATLAIDMSDLPCVCTLIKGVPGGIVSHAGDRLSYEGIVRAANVLRPQAEQARQQWDGLLAELPEIKRVIARLEILMAREGKLQNQILELAASLERAHGIILRPQLAAMLGKRSLTPNRTDALIHEVAGDSAGPVLANSRTQGIRSRATAIVEVGKEIDELTSAHDETRLNRYSAMVEETQESLKRAAESAFAEAGITVWRYLDQGSPLVKAGQMLGLVAKAIGIVRRVAVPTP